VENERATLQRGFLAVRTFPITPLTLSAALSVLVLVGAAAAKVAAPPIVAQNTASVSESQTAADPTDNSADVLGIGDTTDNTNVQNAPVPDEFSDFGNQVLANLVTPYAQLSASGGFTPQAGADIASKAAADVKMNPTYSMHSSSELTTDPDTSAARLILYRSDLQKSLAPLQENTLAEFELFGYYVQTKDKSYLSKLSTAAVHYRAAAAATTHVTVPADAVPYHLAIENALEEFATALDTLVQNADDPFGSVAALRSYNQAESDMFSSFNALTTYYKSKQS
jgi:hypothetical protein